MNPDPDPVLTGSGSESGSKSGSGYGLFSEVGSGSGSGSGPNRSGSATLVARHDAWLRELLTDSSGDETEEKYTRFAESGRWIAEMTGSRDKECPEQEPLCK